MPKYNEFYYLNGYYGVKSAVAYSAEPVQATAINYDNVLVTWLTPTGSYSDFRVVRNQNSIPQTQEDGVVVYSSLGKPVNNSVVDSSNNSLAPLVAGHFAFYRVWVRRADSSSWIPAGDTYTLVPSPHSLSVGRDAVYSSVGIDGVSTSDALVYSDTRVSPIVSTTHQRFLDMLPRVITSNTNSAVDVVQDVYDQYGEPTGVKENSLISAFLSGFSFTLDEFLTFASLIVPNTTQHFSSPTTIFLGSHELAMTLDVEPVTDTQRRLLRHATEIYSEKGTAAGLELLTQSMTAYDATLTDTANLLLSVGDATFNLLNWYPGDNVGNWSSLSSSLTLSVESGAVPLTAADVPATLDTVYCAKILSTVANKSIGLGITNPVTTAIPVTAGLPYSFSFYGKEGTESEGGGETDAVTVELRWYDRKGQTISSSISSDTLEGSSWARYSVANKVAPTGAVYVGIVLTFAATYPIYIDMVQLEQSTTVTAYQEPRGVQIMLAPAKVNFIKNPNFQVDANFWTTVNTSSTAVVAATSTQLARSGPSYFKAVSNGSGPLKVYYNQYIPVTPGLYYSGSMYVEDYNTNKQYEAYIEFYNSSNTLIYTETGDPTSVLTSDWTRVTVSGKAPVNAASARLFIKSIGSTNPASGQYALFDCGQFEQSALPTDYFDGYLVDDGGEFFGTANLSYSGNYPSKSVRIGRLVNEIQNFIGFDTPYYIRTYQTAYSGIS